MSAPNIGFRSNNQPLRPAWPETASLIPTLEAMLADATDPARQAELKTAIEDLKAGRVATLLGVKP